MEGEVILPPSALAEAGPPPKLCSPLCAFQDSVMGGTEFPHKPPGRGESLWK